MELASGIILYLLSSKYSDFRGVASSFPYANDN